MKYFQHDTNAFQDEKITELFIAHGYEGIGLFYTILEKIADKEKPIKTAVLKKQLMVGKKLEKIWSFLEEIGLISTKNGETFNIRIISYLESYEKKREDTRKRVTQHRINQEDSENVTRYNDVSNALKVEEEEEKNKEKKTPSTTTAHEKNGLAQPSATTELKAENREVLKNGGGDSYFHFNIQLKTEAQFRDSTCMSLKIKPEDLPDLIDRFTHEQRAVNKAYPDYHEFKKHCFNWLRIESTKTNGAIRTTPNLKSSAYSNGVRAAYGQGADLSGIVYEQESFK